MEAAAPRGNGKVASAEPQEERHASADPQD